MLFRSDVVIYDPPHVIKTDTPGTSELYSEIYGVKNKNKGVNIFAEFAPFLSEAKRVLAPGGFIFAKLTDHTAWHRFQWASVEFVNACHTLGLEPYDYIVKVRKSAVISSKWKKAHHARRFHSTWTICRKPALCRHTPSPPPQTC